MSFLGCTGYLMSVTGICEALEIVYAGNTVPHLLSGKAVSRALQGHQLLDLVLNTILLEDLVPELGIDSSVLENMMTNAKNGRLDINNAIKWDILNKVENALSEKKKTLSNNRTAALWSQYMHLIDIVHISICAERLGDWHLHISTLQEMLPIFVACGHNNYTKSVWLYLQQMSTLETNYPNLFKQYIDGNHILRRTNFKCWGGIPINQGIEQTLMRDLKFEGGLTRGRGFNSVQRNLFVFLRPLCPGHTMTITRSCKIS